MKETFRTASWQRVIGLTIQNCFRKCGFVQGVSMDSVWQVNCVERLQPDDKSCGRISIVNDC